MADHFHVSPSQQVTFLHGCARSWAFSYIWGLKSDGNRYSDRGKRVHKVLEDWTQLAKPPDLSSVYGQIAFPALAHIPAPLAEGVISEKNILWTSPKGHLFNFLKDLEEPAKGLIWDYKTTSNIAYAKTTTDLLDTDPQGITYAAHRFLVSPLQLIQETWLYLRASKPFGCVPVVAVHDRQHCLEQFALLDDVAGVMLRHRELKTHPMAFPPCPSHCGAYGGCPHKSRCTDLLTLSPLERMKSAMTQPVNSSAFLANIARNALAGPTPGASGPVECSAPAAAPPPPPALPWSTNVQKPQQAPAFGQAAAPVFSPAPALQMPPTFTATLEATLTELAPEAQVPDLVLPTPAVEAPKRRTRRTKAEIAAEPTLVVIDPDDEGPEPEDMTDRYTSRPIVVPETTHIHNTTISTDLTPSMLVRVALQMAANPGYCTLDSVAFAARARSIAAAISAEEGE